MQAYNACKGGKADVRVAELILGTRRGQKASEEENEAVNLQDQMPAISFQYNFETWLR